MNDMSPHEPPAPSLRTRLLRHVMLPLALTWLAATAITLGVAHHFTEQAFDRALLDDAYSIASHVQAMDDGEVALRLTPGEVTAALFDEAESVFFSVLRPDGSRLAGATLPPFTPPFAGQRFRYANALHHGQVVRAVVLRHDVRGEPYHVVMAHTTRVRTALVRQMLVYGALPLLLLLGLLVVWVWRGITRDLAPLSGLQAALAHRDSRDLAPVAVPPATREVEQVGQAVNALFQRLDRSVRAQREFAGNVAHELRTPLARIRALAEDGLAQPEVSNTSQTLQQIASSAERAGRLVNQLLDLAVADEAALVPRRERVALAPQLGQAVLRHLNRADARGIDLGAIGIDDGGNGPVVCADAALLDGILDNLIDNALRYGGTTVNVVLRVDTAARRAEIAVEDDGPGLQPAEREALRARWTQGRDGLRLGQGAGLGLAIVARYAQLLGSELRLDEATSQGGLRASVTLPLA